MVANSLWTVFEIAEGSRIDGMMMESKLDLEFSMEGFKHSYT
jgi:hypothetical protein